MVYLFVIVYLDQVAGMRVPLMCNFLMLNKISRCISLIQNSTQSIWSESKTYVNLSGLIFLVAVINYCSSTTVYGQVRKVIPSQVQSNSLNNQNSKAANSSGSSSNSDRSNVGVALPVLPPVALFVVAGPDSDGDGVDDDVDLDDDNDGILDSDESGNFDMDLYADSLDLDSDNDGIYDIVEAGGIDVNNDGIADDLTDTDNDGWVDLYDDLCITTIDTILVGGTVNVASGTGVTNPENAEGFLDGVDATVAELATIVLDLGDTIPADSQICITFSASNSVDVPIEVSLDGVGFSAHSTYSGLNGEVIHCISSTTSFRYIRFTNNGGGGTRNMFVDGIRYVFHVIDTTFCTLGTPHPLPDTDGDGNKDFKDLNSDNDNCLDVVEAGFTDGDGDGYLGSSPLSTNGRGIVNSGVDGYTGTSTAVTNPLSSFTCATISPTDMDLDGIPNSIDIDDDNDGILDTAEARDFDGDGVADSLDLDSDNDGIFDLIEAGGVDANNDGFADDLTDSDGDGWVDLYDDVCVLPSLLISGYGDSYTASGVVDQPQEALGAPDAVAARPQETTPESYVTVDLTDTILIGEQACLRISSNSATEEFRAEVSVDGVSFVTAAVNGTGFGPNLGYLSYVTVCISHTADFRFVRFFVVDNGGVTRRIDLESISYNFMKPQVCANGTPLPLPDTDLDGKKDVIDLDSDEDGCFDVREAGFTDGNADGILGSSPITVHAFGFLTSGVDGYTGTNSSVTDQLVLACCPTAIGKVGLDTIICYNETVAAIQLISDTVWIDTVLSVLGCDSIYDTTKVNVLEEARGRLLLDTLVCVGQNVSGNSINVDTFWIDTTFNMLGCDSVYDSTVVRVVNYLANLKLDTTVCYGATVNGNLVLNDTIWVDTILLSAPGNNLIINPSAEVDPLSLGWTAVSTGTNCYTGSNWRVTGSQNGFPPTVDGAQFFYSGCGSVNGELYQEIDLSSYAINIDSGLQGFLISTNIRSYAESPPDTGQIILDFLDASMAVLGSFTSGKTTNTTGWVNYVGTIPAPVGTRSFRITLKSFKGTAFGTSVDAYFDDFAMSPSSAGCDTLFDTTRVKVRLAPTANLELDTTVCFNELVGGMPQTANNFWIDTTFNSLGCDSLYDTTRVTVLPLATANLKLDTTVCFGELVNGTPQTTNNFWIDTTFNSIGCDSLYDTTRVTVLPIAGANLKLDTTVCFNELVNGNAQTSDNFWVDTTFNSLGCDSLYDTTRVTVLPLAGANLELDTTVCFNELVGGIAQTANNFWIDTTFNIAGCDSIYDTTRVTVLPIAVANLKLDTTVCFNEMVNGIAQTANNFWIDTTFNSLGCDSLYDTTRVTVLPIATANLKLDTTVCFNELVNGNVQTSDNFWVDTTFNSLGCDSLYDTTRVTVLPLATAKLKLDTTVCFNELVGGIAQTANNFWIDTAFNLAGCDSIYDTTRVMVLPIAVANLDLDTTVCFNELINGNPQTATNFWIDTTFNSLGCDSIYDTTHVTVLPIAMANLKLDTTVCFNELVNGNAQTSDNFWIDTTLNSLGCDSLYDTTRVTVLPLATANLKLDTTVCFNELVNGNVQTSDNFWIDTTFNSLGCDSLYDTTRVTVLPAATANLKLDTTVCFNELVNGIAQTANNFWIDTTFNIASCDSLYDTTRVTVLPIATANLKLDTTVCFNELVNGTPQTATNFWIDTTFNNLSCDSIYDTTRVTVLPIATANFKLDTTVCFSELVNGTPQTTNNFWIDTTLNSLGCDSIYDTTRVTVLPAATANLKLDTTVCFNELVNGNAQTANNFWIDTTYNSVGCDSIYDTTRVTVLPIALASLELDTIVCFNEMVNGIAQTSDNFWIDTTFNSLGCDSLYDTTRVTVLPIAAANLKLDTTVCFNEVVNGNAQTANNFWIDTTFNSLGCDSIYDTTRVTVLPLVGANLKLDTTVCFNELVNGIAQTTNNFWIDTTFNSVGCDSIYDTTRVTVLPIALASLELDTIVCFNEMVNGIAQTSDNFWIDTTFNSLGCDSLYDTTRVTVLPIAAANLKLDTTVCFNEVVNGNAQTANNFWIDTTFNSLGCDSIYDTTRVTVLPLVGANLKLDTTVCFNELVNGNAQTTNNFWIDTTFNSLGCDSIYDTTRVTVLPIAIASLESDTIVCFNEMVNGIAQTSDNFWIDTTFNSLGCDSLYDTTRVTVLPIATANLKLDTTVCFNEVVNGNAQTANNFWIDTTFNSLGCDSIYDTTRVTVLPIATAKLHLDTTVCFNALVNGNAQTTNNLWIDTTFNSVGCDSIYDTTRVTVLPIAVASLELDTTVCFNELVNGIAQMANNFWIDTTFNSLGCDSIYDTIRVMVLPDLIERVGLDTTVCLNEIVRGKTIITDSVWIEIITNSLGCDSIKDTIRVTLAPNFVANIDTVNGSSGCDSVHLGSGSNAGFSFEWFRNGISISGMQVDDSLLTATSSGSYNVEVTNNFGCTEISNSIPITISILSASIDTIGSSQACDSVGLISTGNAGAMFEWLFNGNSISGASLNDSIQYALNSGQYQVVVDNGICVDTSIITVVTIDTSCSYPPTAFNDSIIVTTGSVFVLPLINDVNPLSDTLTITIIDSTSGGTLVMNNDSLLFTAHSDFCGTDSMIYQICNADGCDTAMIYFFVSPPDSDGDGIPDYVESLDADTDQDGIFDYLSTDSDGDGIPDSVEAMGDLSDPCNIILADTDGDSLPDYVDLDSDDDGVLDAEEWDTDNDGITGDDCDGNGILDFRDPQACQVNLFIPEVFTPNGDGDNDRFEILGLEAYPDNSIVIFNRWGNKLYESTPYMGDWDGTVQFGISLGTGLPEGTYYYVLNLDQTGNNVRKGYVYLKR